MFTLTAALLTVGVILFTLAVRERDLPAPETVPPGKHLEDRRATIYENLRDLQFEYRLGKLSDHDYEQTKTDLQKELAAVLAQIEAAGGGAAVAAAPAPKPEPNPAAGTVCPHCGAKFPKPLKFCGECGKPMSGGAA